MPGGLGRDWEQSELELPICPGEYMEGPVGEESGGTAFGATEEKNDTLESLIFGHGNSQRQINIPHFIGCLMRPSGMGSLQGWVV